MKYSATIIRIIFFALFIYLTIAGNTMLWLALFGVSLILAVVLGRIYCGYICPINTVIIPIDWLAKKLKIQTDKAPKWLEKGFFPWIFLGLSVIFMVVSKKMLHINLPILVVWIVVSILVTLRYSQYVFHNLLCPFGALQKTFGKFAIFSKMVDKNTCVGCKKCKDVCPADAIIINDEDKKAVINTELCHQCTKCADVCPTSSINYINRKK